MLTRSRAQATLCETVAARSRTSLGEALRPSEEKTVISRSAVSSPEDLWAVKE